MNDPVTAEKALKSLSDKRSRCAPSLSNAEADEILFHIESQARRIVELEQQASDMTRVQNELHERLYQAQRAAPEPEGDARAIQFAMARRLLNGILDSGRLDHSDYKIDVREWLGRNKIGKITPTKGAVK